MYSLMTLKLFDKKKTDLCVNFKKWWKILYITTRWNPNWSNWIVTSPPLILGLIKLSCLCNRPNNEWNKWYYAKFISNMFLINYLFLLIILHAELHIFGYWVLKKKCLGICNECQIIFADCSDTSYQLFNLWSALTDRLTIN